MAEKKKQAAPEADVIAELAEAETPADVQRIRFRHAADPPTEGVPGHSVYLQAHGGRVLQVVGVTKQGGLKIKDVEYDEPVPAEPQPVITPANVGALIEEGKVVLPEEEGDSDNTKKKGGK